MELSGIRPSPDFRAYLQSELVRRCKSNPKYSLRAFARLLEVEPSFLSKILNRKRVVTENTLNKFGSKMGLSPNDLQTYRAGLPGASSGEGQLAADYQQLTLDHFQMIADWYHYAILELITVKNFKSDPKWVARALGISVAEVSAAVERLIRLDYIEISARGKWLNRSGNNTTVGNEFTAIAFRRLQQQILSMATTALEEVPLELRDQSSMTVAIDTRLLPEAKLRIKKFRREMARLVQKSGSWNEVYQLGISFYPLTKPRD